MLGKTKKHIFFCSRATFPGHSVKGFVVPVSVWIRTRASLIDSVCFAGKNWPLSRQREGEREREIERDRERERESQAKDHMQLAPKVVGQNMLWSRHCKRKCAREDKKKLCNFPGHLVCERERMRARTNASLMDSMCVPGDKWPLSREQDGEEERERERESFSTCTHPCMRPIHRYNGTPVHWHTGTRAHCFTVAPMHKYTGTPAHTSTLVTQYTGTPVQQHTGTPVHRYTSTPIPWYTGTPAHWYTGISVHNYVDEAIYPAYLSRWPQAGPR